MKLKLLVLFTVISSAKILLGLSFMLVSISAGNSNILTLLE